jgi:hypothetical protein
MMVGVVKMHGDVCAYFRMVESTDSIATYETQRRGEPTPVKLSYTIQQANAAGLTGKGTWKAHPAAMLRARCSSALARIVYPDLVNGLYDPDEIEDAPRASVSAVSAVVEAKAQTAARPSDASALGDIYQRLEAAADEGAFKALAAEAVAAARAGKISDADLSAFKDAHKAHKAQWIASQPPAPVDDLPEPGSDG